VLELNSKSTDSTNNDSPRSAGQSRRLWLALALLMIAFVAIIIKDRDIWFGPDGDSDVIGPEVTESKPTESKPPQPAPTVADNLAKPQTQLKKASPKNQHPAATASKSQPIDVTAKNSTEQNSTQQSSAQSGAVATERTVLPPLDVEVVAGDKHSTIHPGSNAAKVVIANAQPTPATNAAERAPLSTTIPLSASSGETGYPMLAQQTKVQGSVILQAIIGADGLIEDLRVLAGPAILSSAAREAVRPWRFKPYLQNGQAVETKAKITVNFTIRVADTFISGS
jgi:TonB family protein